MKSMEKTIGRQNESTGAPMVTTEFPILSNNTSIEELNSNVENGLKGSQSSNVEKIEIFSGSSKNKIKQEVTKIFFDCLCFTLHKLMNILKL